MQINLHHELILPIKISHHYIVCRFPKMVHNSVNESGEIIFRYSENYRVWFFYLCNESNKLRMNVVEYHVLCICILSASLYDSWSHHIVPSSTTERYNDYGHLSFNLAIIVILNILNYAISEKTYRILMSMQCTNI